MMAEGLRAREHTFPWFRSILLLALAVLSALWIVPALIDAIGGIDITGVDRPYILTALFVWWDALIPVFPSESLLNAGATVIAAGQSELELGLLILAGAAGAIVGDSSLYWLARTVGRRYAATRTEQAKRNPKAQAVFSLFTSNAPLLLIGGRFVPGLRFVIGATMGLERYPYTRFLLWSSIGGTLWAAYTCGFSYLVGQKLGGYPVLSIAISAIITTILLGALYVPLKRRYQRSAVDGLPHRPELGAKPSN